MTGWAQRSAEMAEEAADALDRANEELATLRKDAERYRWLKSVASTTLCGIAYRVPYACKFDDPDAAIDAAITASANWPSPEASSDAP